MPYFIVIWGLSMAYIGAVFNPVTPSLCFAGAFLVWLGTRIPKRNVGKKSDGDS